MTRAAATTLALAALLALAPAARADEDPPEPTPPSSAEIVNDTPDEPPLPTVIEADDEAALTRAAEDPARYGAVLRWLIEKVEARLLPKIEEKIEHKQEASMARFSTVLSVVSLFGIFLLATPLVLRRRYPGKAGILWKYSAIAAGTFFVAVNLFGGVLMLLRTVQGELGKATNPQIAIVTASLATLHENADHLASIGPTILQPTLEQLQHGDTDEPMPVAFIDNIVANAAGAKTMADAFLGIARFFRSVNWIFGYLPMVMTLVAVLLFLMAVRPMLREIVLLPARAASGESRVASRTLKRVFRRIGRELLATLCLIGALIAVMQLTGLAISLALKPAMEAFFAYLFSSVIYIQIPGAMGGVLLASLGGAILFVVLNLAVMTLASSFYLAKLQKIFQRKFHDQVPLSAHQRFWRWGTLALMLHLVLPIAFVALARIVIAGPLSTFCLQGEEVRYTTFFLAGPLLLVGGFIGTWFAAQGLRALLFLRRYKVDAVAPIELEHDTEPHPLAA
jgi:hypothetical protein